MTTVAGPGVVGAATASPHRLERWARRRRWPLLLTGLTLAAATLYSMYWGDAVQHAGRWDVPGDLWFTLQSSLALAHGHFGQVYAPTDHLITFPGILVVLAPVAELVSVLHLPLGMPVTVVTYPTAWVVVGPYEILVASTALFALDDVARRLATTGPRRLVLLPVQAVALWSVTVLWGHPEDALAVALLLWGVLALSDGRWRGAGWLLGAAVATQPLVLLALPAVLPALRPVWSPTGAAGAWRAAVGRLAHLGARIVLPSAVLLAGPLLASWSTTVRALLDQPNDAAVDHPTPWVNLAPSLGHGMVASGPGRLLAFGVAVAAGVLLWRRHRAGPPPLATTLWVVAGTLALRCAFEPVLDAYYVWPALAVALAVSGRPRVRWPWPCATAVTAVGLTALSQARWAHPLTWWLAVVGLLAAALVASRPPLGDAEGADRAAPTGSRPVLTLVRGGAVDRARPAS